MTNGQRIRIRKLGFQPDSARRQPACAATGKLPVVRDSQDGYLPQKETK
jgi:hypothetical protein